MYSMSSLRHVNLQELYDVPTSSLDIQSDPNIEESDRENMRTELGPHKRDTFMSADLLVS